MSRSTSIPWALEPPPVNPSSKFAKDLYPVAADLLTGTVLVVDPSCGSWREETQTGSLPGYALYHQGQLSEAGVVQVTEGSSLAQRLWEIAQELKTFESGLGWPSLTALVLEKVPPLRFGRRGFGSAARQMPLHYATGAVMGAVRAETVLFIHPGTWHAYIRDSYVKADDTDAIVMGHATMEIARALVVRRAKRKAAGTKKAIKTRKSFPREV